MKLALRVLASLKTTLVLVGILVALSAWGSLAIQFRPGDYAAIEDSILWEWLRTTGAARPGAAWWVASLAAVTALLAVNTGVCVVQRLDRHRRSGRMPARALFAHLAHLGFLLVLGAHLVGAVTGFRSDGHAAFPGQSFSVEERPGWTYRVSDVRVDFAPQGYPRFLEAEVEVREGDQLLTGGAVRVNQPLHARGVAAYLKAAQPSLRGWHVVLPDGRPRRMELGRPTPLGEGTLTLLDWTRTPDRRIAVRVSWEPDGAPRAHTLWLAPAPGQPLGLPSGPPARWGDIAVDTLGIFDIRYDPGAGLALAGSALLSLSLIPLLWRGRRHEPAPAPPHGTDDAC
ncbi:MAG: cytochrome c biogenesis protein ResB [Deferrisomatales bacterium]